MEQNNNRQIAHKPENQNLAAERAILSHYLREPGDSFKHNLEVQDFSDLNNQFIFFCIQQLYKVEKTPSVANILIAAQKKNRDQLTEDYLNALLSTITNSAEVQGFADAIRHNRIQRDFVASLYSMIQAAQRGTLPSKLKTMVAESMDKVFNGGIGASSTMKFGEDLAKIKHEILNFDPEAYFESGVYTGIPSVDEVTDGFRDGTYILIAASTGVGKTALGLKIIVTNLMLGKVGYFGSMEMKKKALMLRMISQHLRIPFKSLVRGKLTQREKDLFMEKSGEVEALIENHLRLHSKSGLSVADIKAELYAHKAAHGKFPDFAVIDYLQIMDFEESNGKGFVHLKDWEKTHKNSHAFRQLRDEIPIPFFVLAQANPVPQGQRLTRENIAGGQQPHKDADIVIMMSREQSYQERTDGCDILRLNFDKTRLFAPCEVLVKFNGMTQDFSDHQERAEPLPPVMNKEEWDEMPSSFGRPL